jgi:hypothetical protein
MKNPNLWIGKQPDPNDRLQLEVPSEDLARVRSLPKGASRTTVTVTDLQSNKRYVLRRAACGLVCFCALELVDPDVDSFLLNERQSENRVQ